MENLAKSTEVAVRRVEMVDFPVGVYFTVIHGPIFKDGSENRSYHGSVFKLMAVNLPFIAAKWMTLKNVVHAFDVREYRFVKVSDEYVDPMKINW